MKGQTYELSITELKFGLIPAPLTLVLVKKLPLVYRAILGAAKAGTAANARQASVSTASRVNLLFMVEPPSSGSKRNGSQTMGRPTLAAPDRSWSPFVLDFEPDSASTRKLDPYSSDQPAGTTQEWDSRESDKAPSSLRSATLA